jgi:hypothetical protein
MITQAREAFIQTLNLDSEFLEVKEKIENLKLKNKG